MWDLTGVYASLSRVLNRFLNEKKYYKEDYHPPVLIKKQESIAEKSEDPILLFPPHQYGSLTKRFRKSTGLRAKQAGSIFLPLPNLAWKTGTSFGFRDGWAVGTTPEYVIGVWAGNADGEGRPGLTGISAAAPILFDLVNLMGSGNWFNTPYEDITMIRVCSKSGFRAGPDCHETVEIPACVNGLRSEACPYHQIIHLNSSETLQVTSDCAAPSEIKNVSWFVLPPAMEYFYRQKHPGYKTLPPVSPGCSVSKNIPVMEFIYPTSGIRIFIPRDQTGVLTRVIPEVVHRNPSKKIFWHLDETYISTTRFIHQIELLAGTGNHILTVVDEDGNTIRCPFYDNREE